MAECKRENLTTAEVAAKALEMRRMIIEMLTEAGSGHPGGSLSATDIIATLFFREMYVDVNAPKWRTETVLFSVKDMLLLLFTVC